MKSEKMKGRQTMTLQKTEQWRELA